MNFNKGLGIVALIIVVLVAGFLSFKFFGSKEKGNDNLATVNISQSEKEAMPTFTDDNSGETVIIKSDQENYTGDLGIESYFSVQNTGQNDENFDIQFYFPKNVKVSVEKVEYKTASGWQDVGSLQSAVARPEEYKTKKPISVEFEAEGRFNALISSGETKYFRAKIIFDENAQGEFWIEAIGDKGGYGLLDPTFSHINIRGEGSGGGGVRLRGGSSGGGGGLVADIFIDMNTSSPGTTLTTTILGNGTIGTYDGWALSTTPITGITVGAHNIDRLSAVTVNSTSYPINHTSQSIAFDHTQSGRTVNLGIPSGHKVLTVSGWITFGPSDQGFGSGLFDYIVIQDVLGHHSVIQLRNGNINGDGSGYGLRIETDFGGISQSSAIMITPGSTYWVTLKHDEINGLASMAIYNTSGIQVGSTVTTTLTTGNDDGSVLIGNNEAKTESGRTSYFENLIIDYTNAVFPLGPSAPTIGNTIGNVKFR